MTQRPERASQRPRDGHEYTLEEREAFASHLKERVYITFTALAVVLALQAHVESPGTALGTLLITVLGAVLAVFTSDVVAHLAAHEVLPTRTEVGHMAQVSFGALASVVLPVASLLVAVAGGWSTSTALVIAATTLIGALVAISYFAVRRSQLQGIARVGVLVTFALLGCLVVALELLAHG